MTLQVFEVTAKTIFPNMQSETIVRMSSRPVRNAVITQHDDLSPLEPRREANCSRPIQQLKSESLQDLLGAPVAPHIAMCKE